MSSGRRIDALLADYGSYHRTRGNLVCLFLVNELVRVRPVAGP